MSPRRLLELSALFSPPAEVMADFRGKEARDIEPPRGEILAMLRRRPCTADQIAAALGIAPLRVDETVRQLLKENKIEEKPSDGETYLSAV